MWIENTGSRPQVASSRFSAGIRVFFSNRSPECFKSGWRARIRTWAKGSKVLCATTTQLAKGTRKIIAFGCACGNAVRCEQPLSGK